MSRKLDELLSAGRLSPVSVILGPRDQVNRRLYWTTELKQCCEKICRSSPVTRALIDIPSQINLAFADFISGRPLSSGLVKCDPPRGAALWRLKTPDIRLYGWAHEEQCLILSQIQMKSILLAPGSPTDTDMGRKTVKDRLNLQLEPLYGERYKLFPVIC